jgi:hypothetical protein
MAIYNPPKQTATGGIMSGVGTGLMTAGGAMTLATGGLGGAVGIPLMALGALTSVAGTIINGNQTERANNYEVQYANQLQGEKNQKIAYSNNLNQSRANYTPQGVNASMKAINDMISPSSNVPSNGGTGFSNQRLI